MKELPDGTPYIARQKVAHMERIGYFHVDNVKYTMWGYLTFYCGPDEVAIAAKFDRIAQYDEQGELVTFGLKPGEIVVKPGFVYKTIPMTGMILTEHLRRMRTWKPKPTYEYEKSDEAAVDLGVINTAGNA